MNWKQLTTDEAFDTIIEASQQQPQLIFKHSTRCSISSMARSRIERDWNLNSVDPWYLDLIAYRNISDLVAFKLGVKHESPQAIVIKDGKAVYHASHNDIRVSDIANRVS